MSRGKYPIWLAMGAMILVWSNHASAQAYKCKNANGTTEFSDQPCRGTTAKSVEKEYISESQRRSSTEWLQRGAADLKQKERAEAAAQQEAQRQEVARQAAMREDMRRQQESNERQRLIAETERARIEAAEAKAAAGRAEAAANNAANAAGKRRPTNCYQKMNGAIYCN